MAFGPAALAQTTLSAVPLFVGENNIFSGKGRQATKQLEKTFNKSQSMGLPGEYDKYLQKKQMMANTGLSSSALGLYNRQSSRALGTGIRQLGMGSPGGALAGIGAMMQSQQDSALNLAQMEDAARRQNMANADQALLTVGGLKRQEQLRKLDEAANYWGTRKAESNAAITSSLKGVASSLANSQLMDAYGAGENGLKGLFKGVSKFKPGQMDMLNNISNNMALSGVQEMGKAALKAYFKK